MGVHLYVMQHHLVIRIAEVHIIESYLTLQLCVGYAAIRLMRMPPGSDVCLVLCLNEVAVLVFFRIDKLHIAVVLFRFLIHEREKPVGTG